MTLRFSLLLAFVLAAAVVQPLAAETFAILTQVYADGDKTPVAENVTIFEENRIVDFLVTEPARVTVFEIPNRKFTLALTGAKKKTVLTAEELIRFAATEQTRALESNSELIRFAASPSFRESFDDKSGVLTMTSPHWDYRVSTARDVSPAVLDRYGEFANWYTHLNALFRPVPPGVRLELNRALAQHACLPTQVAVRIKRNGRTEHEQESHHQLLKSLTEKETKLLTGWKTDEPKMDPISIDQFRTSIMQASKSP